MTKKIGIEIEFADLPIYETTELVHKIFGGSINKQHTNHYVVEGSEIGDIDIELDADIAQRLSSEIKEFQGGEIIGEVLQYIDQKSSEAMSLAVPIEIVFPPIDKTELSKADQIITKLRDAGAKGSYQSFMYAFGVHLNVEAAEKSTEYFQKILLSFFLLQAWLALKTRQDMSRVISGYNKLYSYRFGQRLMQEKFGSLDDLIDFYKEEAPSRDYALDMYPIWAELKPDSIKNVKDHHLISARPTFHYRLPDCKLSNESWSFSWEYKLWQNVEKLAQDNTRLKEISDFFSEEIDRFEDPFNKKWLSILENKWGYR